MNTNINDFIDKICNWKDNFEILRYPSKKNGKDDISIITNYIRENKVQELLDYTKKFYVSEYFSLPHPDNDKVVTYPFASVSIGYCNFLFMTDELQEKPWMLVQAGNFLDCFFTHTGIIYHVNRRSSWLPAVSNLSKLINKEKLKEKLKENNFKKKKTTGILISSNRPYHFFYDQLYVINYISKIYKTNRVYYNDIFWPIQDIINSAEPQKRKSDIKNIYISPKAISQTNFYKNNKLVNKTMTEFEEKCLRSKKTLLQKKFKENQLKIVLNISTEKRKWVEQSDGYSEIINNLSNYFDRLFILFDGMTSQINQPVNTEENIKTYTEILEKIKKSKKIETHIIFGKTYPDKIEYYNDSDLVISPMGSSAIIPLRFTKNNTIQFSNIDMGETVSKSEGDFFVINRELKFTSQEKPKLGNQWQHADYHIPWQHIFNLSVSLINKTKNKEIPLLPIPLNKKEKNIFYLNQKRLKGNNKVEDVLREVALAFERSGNIQLAYELISKAHEIKPNGPLINLKLNEYKQKLDEQ
ncbi:hypothetical protein [Leucothrix arctica]|uniref:Uncharacterized protein n=1 Tax=Leucothrix arctica TaxID=1481894 RepID=A0A317CQW9_9GAMM|nr:hypothetical protein [Leucothrix arctica]PWQ98682.1 hypothetical protein DKT75_02405 [Leucothrix arctica]